MDGLQVDRAVELMFKYKERVQRWESKQKEQDDFEAYYLDKMDAGLYTLQVGRERDREGKRRMALQNVVYVLGEVCVHMNSARMRAIKLLKMKSGEERLTKHLIPILAEYQENLGESADTVRNHIEIRK